MSAGRLDANYHEARLLLLLDAFATQRKPLSGLTKLAKLDFLLRYPVFLERLLTTRGVTWPSGAEPTATEREAVESTMIRYKYGPWDDAYYGVIGSLISRGLVESTDAGRTTLRLTADGRRVAAKLGSDPAWRVVARRARVLKSHFDVTGNSLKDMIYAELPDAVDRPQRTEIR